jgi:hypothetical protein
MRTRGQPSEFDVRETLDEAVRHLAVSSSPLQERVRAAGMVILAGLSPTDFGSSEDRELFDQIHAAFADASSSDGSDRSSAVTVQMPDETAEGIASDILDLRDTMMGRAIMNARRTTHAEVRRGSRR